LLKDYMDKHGGCDLSKLTGIGRTGRNATVRERVTQDGNAVRLERAA
jgi:hypothetical protein